MKKVSIIIPIYNTSGYLRNCIDSIISQTFQNLQIILIDDGSTDDSGSICDWYAKLDKRVKVIHKVNEGVSIARNVGLNNAEGEYLMFFDSDDIVLPRMVEDLLSVAEKLSIDIVQSGNFVDGKKDTNTIVTYTKDEALDELFLMTNKVKPSMCLGLYRKEVFDGVTFPTHIHFYEDFAVQCHVVSKSDGVAIIDNRYYSYIERVGSATKSGLTEKKWSMALIPDYLNKEHVCRNLQDYKSLICDFIAGKLFYSIILNDVTSKDIERYRHLLLKHFFNVLCANNVKLRKRVIPTLYLIFPYIVQKTIKKILVTS